MQAAKKRGADQRQAVAWVLGLGVAIGMCTTVSALAAEKVGYSAPFLTDPFQAVMVNQTLAAVKTIGLDALPPTNANGDAGKQATDIRNLISSGANVLIINPADSQAIVPSLAFAASKTIPVVSIDIAPASGKLAMIVRADNKGIGALACEASEKGSAARARCFP
jgi:ribose transport system substrate-binding protein